MYSGNEGSTSEEGSPKIKNELELVNMLKHMTKKTFIEGVSERRFVVTNVKGNKYAVYMITVEDTSAYMAVPVQYGMAQVVNPNTKDGLWNQNGGGYNKSHACMEDIARYVDDHAEDKDEVEESCAIFFMYKQRLNEI
jgi:hypothetical protein